MSNIPHGSPNVSDLIFSSASQDISRFRREDARAHLSIRSRLRSIEHDATFVERIARSCDLPLAANERCGSWYIKPSRKRAGVYFKSTDGHFGQWAFSLRRLNVALFEVIEECGGCIIVDSTRRGKSMPDALSKTIPIWASVWNRTLFPSRPDAHSLRTPTDVVSASEHVQIEARLASMTLALRGMDIDPARTRLSKPLWPVWVTQDNGSIDLPDRTRYHPIVLCTASGRIAGLHDGAGFDYVQGAADDHEAWAHGLTPALYWTYLDRLLGCSEDKLPDVIGQLVATDQTRDTDTGGPRLVAPTTQFFLGARTDRSSWDLVVDMSPATAHVGRPTPSRAEREASAPRSSPPTHSQPAARTAATEAGAVVIHLPCAQGKLGSRALRTHLRSMTTHIHHTLKLSHAAKILFTSSDPRSITDHAAGALLVALCVFVDDWGQVRQDLREQGLDYSSEARGDEDVGEDDKAEQSLREMLAHVRSSGGKEFIRRRLGWICVACPDVNPSRATLQSVNAFLLGQG